MPPLRDRRIAFADNLSLKLSALSRINTENVLQLRKARKRYAEKRQCQKGCLPGTSPIAANEPAKRRLTVPLFQYCRHCPAAFHTSVFRHKRVSHLRMLRTAELNTVNRYFIERSIRYERFDRTAVRFRIFPMMIFEHFRFFRISAAIEGRRRFVRNQSFSCPCISFRSAFVFL